MNKLVFALIASIAAVGAAQAQTVGSTTPHFYAGIGAATSDNVTTDDYRTGAKVYGGYQIDQNWAVEGGYTWFDKQDFNRSGVRGDVKSENSYIAGKYTYAFNDRFSGFAKLGVAYTERKLRSNVGGYNDNDTGLYGGLGVQYKLNQNVSLIGEYERYGKDKELGAKADVYTVGVQYDF